MRIAVVGSGISGLSAAWLLNRAGYSVSLFEANDYLGGHSHTIDITLENITYPVDTGFLVFNQRTYPLFTELLRELAVPFASSDMSFSVRHDALQLEWAGTTLATLFTQRKNLVSPRFWRMLIDVIRFNRAATIMVKERCIPAITLGEYLSLEKYSVLFRDAYLLPMAAAIWSAPQCTVSDFSLSMFIHFCHNHGLLQIVDRPQWYTVVRGAREYVQRLALELPDIRIATPVLRVRRRAQDVLLDSSSQSNQSFDHVVLACHSDQALALLDDADTEEKSLLKAIHYQTNQVIVHTDSDLMPRNRRAWSSWNTLAVHDPQGSRAVAVSYLLNKLQVLPFKTPVIITLNPPFAPRADKIIDRFDYAHPLLDEAANRAQQSLIARQGKRHTWFCGAWLGYGFHEDGLRSATELVDKIKQRYPVPLARQAA